MIDDIVDFTRKQYDPQLDHDNEPAEIAIFEYLQRTPGIFAVVRFPFGRKDIDLAYETADCDHLWGAEVEWRKKWWPEQDETFQWDPIRVPLRKLRLAQHYREHMIYYGVRADLRRAYTFTGLDILAGIKGKIGPHVGGDEDEGFVSLPECKPVYVELA